MSEKYTENDLKKLASQLRNPTGEGGKEVAVLMNEGNIEMTKAAIKALNLKFGQTVLELGHGNADHLPLVLNEAEFLNYFGLDISETMKAEAERINKKWIDKRSAFFSLYDGSNIPFKNKTFDAIMTVNTIYFWENPVHLLKELIRVLKPGGRLSVAFGKKSFMQNLPFVKYDFQLYSDEDFKELALKTDFNEIEIQSGTDSTISKTGEPVEREFHVAILTK